jgi:hypothetical protein
MWEQTTPEQYWSIEGNFPPFKEPYPADAAELEADRVARDLESAKTIASDGTEHEPSSEPV